VPRRAHREPRPERDTRGRDGDPRFRRGGDQDRHGDSQPRPGKAPGRRDRVPGPRAAGRARAGGAIFCETAVGASRSVHKRRTAVDWMRRLLVFAALAAALPVLAQDRFIVVASTTSTEQSGLFGYLLPIFQKKTGIQVRVVALGT